MGKIKVFYLFLLCTENVLWDIWYHELVWMFQEFVVLTCGVFLTANVYVLLVRNGLFLI